MWQVSDEKPVHVWPINDWVEHELSEDCVCGPEIIPLVCDDGSMEYMIVHHSLDNREALEET